MKSKYINKIGLPLVAAMVLFSGCSKQLEIKPVQSIDAGTALNTRDGINASITSIYASLKTFVNMVRI